MWLPTSGAFAPQCTAAGRTAGECVCVGGVVALSLGFGITPKNISKPKRPLVHFTDTKVSKKLTPRKCNTLNNMFYVPIFRSRSFRNFQSVKTTPASLSVWRIEFRCVTRLWQVSHIVNVQLDAFLMSEDVNTSLGLLVSLMCQIHILIR